MFVLTAEGHKHLDRGTWSTHKVLGVFKTSKAAEKALPGTKASRTEDAQCGEALYFLTNTKTGEMINLSD